MTSKIYVRRSSAQRNSSMNIREIDLSLFGSLGCHGRWGGAFGCARIGWDRILLVMSISRYAERLPFLPWNVCAGLLKFSKLHSPQHTRRYRDATCSASRYGVLLMLIEDMFDHIVTPDSVDGNNCYSSR